MPPALIHSTFDLLAWLSAVLLALTLRRRLGLPMVRVRQHPFYLACITLGGAVGAFTLGTANLWLSGQPGVAKSILGAIIGAIAAVEIYKRATGLRGSTGVVLAAPLALGIAIGRVGCFLSGLDDFTHGVATDLPWGWDYGDSIRRHPVQLYEAAAMLACFAALLTGLAGRRLRQSAFYLLIAAYALQRFAWEFLKPYPTVSGPLNIFHIACLGLLIYCWVMLRRTRPGDAWDPTVCVSRPDHLAVRGLPDPGAGQDRP
jgi:hypothetical protein